MLEFSDDSQLAAHIPVTSELLCPALLHTDTLNDLGDILYGEAKHSVHDSQRSRCYFFPYSNYTLDQDCINTHN